MGFEYKLRFRMPERETLDGWLRSLRGFESFDGERQVYVFDTRAGRDPRGRPCLEAMIEADGLYACDFGGGRQLLEELRQAIAARCGETRIDDYE